MQGQFLDIERPGEYRSFPVENDVTGRCISRFGLGGHKPGFVLRVKLPDENRAIGSFSGPRQVKKVLSVGQKTWLEMPGFLLIQGGNCIGDSAFGRYAEYSFF